MADTHGNAIAKGTIPKSFGLVAATQGSLDGNEQCRKICTDTAGTVIEQMLLGLVAYRVGKKIEYDGKAGRVTNCPEANALLSKKYRPGWTLHG
ncbi:MAG: hypothetical protein U9Q07_01900 [Planctomycetota bacterium]|nr:hypothetical protein [Planctomycetota bacterium]